MRFLKGLVKFVGLALAVVLGVFGLVAIAFRGLSTPAYITCLVLLVIALACRFLYVQLTKAVALLDAQDVAAVSRATRFEASQRGFFLIGMFGLITLGSGWVGALMFAEARYGMAALAGALALFMGVCGIELLRQALRPGPTLSMDLRGIDHASFGRIPWQEVIGLNFRSLTVRYSTHHFLEIGVRQPHRFLEQLSWPLRLRNRAWSTTRPAYGHLQIALNVLDKRAELIHDAALAFRKRVDAPWVEAWYAEMPPRLVEAMLKQEQIYQQIDRARDTASLDAAIAQSEAVDATLAREVLAEGKRIRNGAKYQWVVVVGVLLLLALKAWLAFTR